jgi:hypothetical protein
MQIQVRRTSPLLSASQGRNSQRQSTRFKDAVAPEHAGAALLLCAMPVTAIV